MQGGVTRDGSVGQDVPTPETSRSPSSFSPPGLVGPGRPPGSREGWATDVGSDFDLARKGEVRTPNLSFLGPTTVLRRSRPWSTEDTPTPPRTEWMSVVHRVCLR